MSNLVCMAVSKIKPEAKLEYNKDLGPEKTFKLYEAMSEIVQHSCETFIQEEFEFVIFDDEVDNYQQIFDKNFTNVYETWQEDGPNNILFLDTDTLVVKPVSIFGKLQHFQMFNYTDPKVLSGDDANNKYGLQHPHYFNAGVRYYPSGMSEEVWKLGWKYAKDWDYDIWGTEQIIFNEMMYSQDPDYMVWHKPDLNFQAMNVQYNDIDNSGLQNYLSNWNGIDMNDAKIMHLHGTRGAGNTVLLQWELWRRITGEEYEFSGIKILKNKETGMPEGITFN